MPYSIQELAALFRSRKTSPVEFTEECLARIDALNPVLNAFITVSAESALTQARAAESEIFRGEDRGPLHGIPVGLKDLIDTSGLRTTAASAVFENRIPKEDAEVVRRLKTAGAVILGKQNLHEFAYGASSMIGCFGEVRNPWDTSRIAGGSSGGSAAAVAAGMGLAAVGTDTAGSIRLPAAYCGVVGLEPAYGRISARGVIPLSPSLDHVGPIARTVADAAAVFYALAGTPASPGLDAHRLRVGVPRGVFFDELDADVASAVERAIEALRPMVAEVRDVAIAVDTDRRLQSAESFRFHREFVLKTPHLYQPETLRRIRSGENISASDYERAVEALKETRRNIADAFDDIDVLVMPTAPVLPALIGELKQHPEMLRPREILMLRNTRPFNVWGLPAVSVPCGFSPRGLPIGLQIAGPPEREDVVLAVAGAYERAAPWHGRTPALAGL